MELSPPQINSVLQCQHFILRIPFVLWSLDREGFEISHHKTAVQDPPSDHSNPLQSDSFQEPPDLW